MLVVPFHANFAAVEYGVWDRTYFYFGGCGPDIFFAISGFIMVVSTRPMWGNRYWWRVFIRRRIVRIVPMYWLFTSFKLFLIFVLPTVALHSPIEAWYVSASYLFIPLINPVNGQLVPLLPVGWTLNFEMWFYVIFAAGLALTDRPVRLIVPVLLVASAIGLFRTDASDAPSTLLDPILWEFLLGMAVGLAMLAGWRLPAQFAFPAVAIGAVALAMPLQQLLVADGGQLNSDVWRVIFFGLPGALLLLAAVSLEGTRWTARASGLVALLGDASYSIYLSHGFVTPAIGQIFRKLHLAGSLAAAISIVASCVCCATIGVMVYRHVERRILNLLRPRIAPTLPSPATGVI